LKKGDKIISPGDAPVLYVVIQGRVDVFIGDTKSFSVQKNGCVGWLSVLTGERNVISAKVFGTEQCIVARFSSSVCEQLLVNHPSFSLRLSKLLLDHITPLIQQVDIAMGWKWLRSGQILIRKGEPTKSLSIILSGRLRAMKTRSHNNRRRFEQEEWGRGMSVGEREVVLNLPSPHTVRAVRDSEIAVISSDVLLAIGQQRPSSIYGFLKYQARASKRGGRDTARTRYRSVALVMLSGGGSNRAMTHQDKNAFDLLCARLCTCLGEFGKTRLVDSEDARRMIRTKSEEELAYVADHVQEAVLSRWLGHLEDEHDLLLYVVFEREAREFKSYQFLILSQISIIALIYTRITKNLAHTNAQTHT
jgi:CRP-like cAMP-binding protein